MRMEHSTQVTIVVGLGAIAAALVLFGCQSKSTVASWQPNGTPVHMDANEPWWNYQLVYHPNSGVYFESYSQTWHWQEDGAWRSSGRRPQPVAWHADEAVVVKLNWDTPEYGHTSVAMMHPKTRVSWNRMHAMTVPPIVNEDTALTNAPAPQSAQPASSTDSYTIVMPKSAQGSMQSPESKTASAESGAPESDESAKESESESEGTAVAGATNPDSPE